MYHVTIKRKLERKIQVLPINVRDRLKALLNDLMTIGPVLPQWSNFSKLSKNTYHCHLGYHHVACWRNENGTIEIEVYYVGSREQAPY